MRTVKPLLSLVVFTPMAKFENFAALNEWLTTRCCELAGGSHPEQPSLTIAVCRRTDDVNARQRDFRCDC